MNTVAGEKGKNSTVGEEGKRAPPQPPTSRSLPLPQPPPAGPPATAARGRHRYRARLTAPPSSNRHLRRSVAAPAIPLDLGFLFFSGAGRPPTPS